MVVRKGDQIDPEDAGRPGLVGHGLPPGVPGRAPGRAGRAGLDRRRVRLDRRRPGAHRPVGRRGRPADASSPSATSARPTTLADVELFGCRELLPTDEVRERAGAAGRRGAVGPRAVGAPGRGPDLRRHGVLAALAHRRRAPPGRPGPGQRPGPAGRAPADAGPGGRAARRGSGPGRHPGPDLGRRRARPFPACTCPSTACWPTPTPPAWTVTPAPEGPDTDRGGRHRLGSRWSATASASWASCAALVGRRATGSSVCAEGRGSGARRRRPAARARLHRPAVRRRRRPPGS